MLGPCAQVGHWLGLGIGDLVNLFNPELVVLGGLFSQLYSVVEETIADGMRADPRRTGGDGQGRPTALGIGAPLIGAAELAFTDLIRHPSEVATSHQHQPTRSGR